MDWNFWTTLKEDQPRIIPVKFGQNPISGLGGEVISRNYLWTDAHTTDKMWSQKLTLSLWQVSWKKCKDIFYDYCINHMYLDRQALANSVDT